MDLQSLVDTYGYLAIFVGAFLEGETIVAMGGFAAQNGYLDIRLVILAALFAGFLGDELFFFLGRYHGKRILARFPNIARRASKRLIVAARRAILGNRASMRFP